MRTGMTNGEKVGLWLEWADAHGVDEWTAAPPAYRLVWHLGLEVPPPHFVSPVWLALVAGAAFGVLFTVGTSLVAFMIGDTEMAVTWLRVGPLAGPPFGIAMAAYYRFSAWRLKLPRWEDFGEDQADVSVWTTRHTSTRRH